MDQEQSWARRMAQSLVDAYGASHASQEVLIAGIERIAEAAVEMASVKQRKLLGECHAILHEMVESDGAVNIRQGLLDELFKA